MSLRNILSSHTVLAIPTSVFSANSNLNARTYYVVQASGRDDNSGTQRNPFRTLTKALSVMSSGDTCMIGSGTYRESVKLPSGVTLLAISGATPTLTGTTKVEVPWGTYSGYVYVADISKLFDRIDQVNYQVFTDQRAIVEARFPDLPGPYLESMMNYKRAVCQAGTHTNRIVATSLPEGKLVGAYVAVWPGENGLCGWSECTSKISGVSGDTVWLETAISGSEPATGGHPFNPYPGDPFYIFGALSLLNAPGEYYLDKKAEKLYAYMPQGDSPQYHSIDMRDNPVVLRATDASNITIKGLTTSGSGIFFTNVSNLDMENCSIKYADHIRQSPGFAGISGAMQNVTATGKNILIKKCEFGDTDCSGIRIGGENIVLKDNIIHDCDCSGVDGGAGVSVAAGSENAEISYNTIYNSGRCLITFDPAASYKKCVIEHNFLKDNSTLTSDCDAFYAYGTDAGGSEIEYNFVEPGNKNDQGKMQKLRQGLYIDHESKNYSVHNNIIGGVSGLKTNLPDSNTSCYNNTVIGSEYGYAAYGFPKDNANMSNLSIYSNLFINLKKSDVNFWASENGVLKTYFGSVVDGKVQVPIDSSRWPKSGNNVSVKGEVDSNYRFAGNIPPDVGAIEKGENLLKYGAGWKLKTHGETTNCELPGVLLLSRHLRVRFVDNSTRINSVDYALLPGYNGIASLNYAGQNRDIFAPTGLDFESCSTVPKMGDRSSLWDAPRVAPMILEQVNDSTVRLTQKKYEAAGLNVEIVYRLGDDYVDQTITTWPDSDIQSSTTFWASYMLFVQNTSFYLHAALKENPHTRWLEMTSAGHNGTGSGTYFRPINPAGKMWYQFLTDNPVRRQAVFETPASRAATERAGFKLGNLTSFDNFFFGFVDNYVALWIFRQPADGHMTPWISASGAQALRRPAWDFEILSGPQKAGERRTFHVRFVYKPFKFARGKK